MNEKLEKLQDKFMKCIEDGNWSPAQVIIMEIAEIKKDIAAYLSATYLPKDKWVDVGYKPSSRLFALKPINLISKGLINLAPREFLIKRFNMERGCVINICATGCSGKTLFIQNLALSVRYGIPFLGIGEIAPGIHKVLHIDQEQTESLTQRRYERLAAGLDLPGFDGIDRVMLPYKLDDPALNRADVENELVEQFKKYSLVIMDSLRRSILCDENSSQIADILSLLNRVAEKSNVVLVFISHKGKVGEGAQKKQSARGSSAIYDATDVQIDLDAKDDCIALSCAKNRDGMFWRGVEFKMSDGGNWIEAQNCYEKLIFELVRDDIKSKNHNKQVEILKLIKFSTEQSLKHSQIYELIKGDKDKFNLLLSDMIQQKLIIEKNGKFNSRMFFLGENAENSINWGAE